jgi:hypothetical protein
MHAESKIYIGCRKNSTKDESEGLKIITFADFEDEDLFKILELEENE